ncbi:MAG: hypothetical protein LBF16_05425 [Pseudomonadales bacterium]|jgi:hypothetical protein|nr:hypothetical protein [Pseudomonadales bacterium]
MIDALTQWLKSTWLSKVFLHNGGWSWPLSETLHFIGLCMLIGSIGLIDLRLLGLGKGIRFLDLHRFVVFAVAGFALNVVSGSLFLIGEPDQYLLNHAFHFKVAFFVIAGGNVLAFYGTQFQRLKLLGPDDVAPLPARVMAAISLICWIGVIVAGRMLTFYRP